MEKINTKKTMKTYYNELLALSQVQEDEELVKFINGRIAQIEKKASSSSSAKSLEQKANEELREKIVKAMEEGKKYTITDLQKAFDFLAELTNQKVASLMKGLVEGNQVERLVEKRKAYFKLV